MSSRSGFTMVEIVVGLLIVGVVLVYAIPQFGDWLTRESTRAARVTVTTHVAVARSIAVQRGCLAVLHFDAAAGEVWVTACDTQGAGVDTVGQVENLTVRFGTSYVTSGDSVLFTPQGLAFGTTWISMTFSKDGYEADLQISPVGRPVW